MEYTYYPKNICAKEITFHIEGNVVTNIQFVGGCNGNLKAIAKLVDGWTVEDITAKLAGNTCGYKSTSCADQLTIAVQEAYHTENKAS
ncbi:MAG: TIGR03905 family TSCPD domain-containing protein [Peptococcaceae bacterium]|nr:TIGR03905 family TSCPD domain-containing protein [Peptococcaceae bacterium]